MRDFGSCVCGDEVFLQTLVLNSPFRESLFPNASDGGMPKSLRYIDWKRGNPYVFRASDLDELKATPALFARKFDERVDAEIIDSLCAMLGK